MILLFNRDFCAPTHRSIEHVLTWSGQFWIITLKSLAIVWHHIFPLISRCAKRSSFKHILLIGLDYVLRLVSLQLEVGARCQFLKRFFVNENFWPCRAKCPYTRQIHYTSTLSKPRWSNITYLSMRLNSLFKSLVFAKRIKVFSKRSIGWISANGLTIRNLNRHLINFNRVIKFSFEVSETRCTGAFTKRALHWHVWLALLVKLKPLDHALLVASMLTHFTKGGEPTHCQFTNHTLGDLFLTLCQSQIIEIILHLAIKYVLFKVVFLAFLAPRDLVVQLVLRKQQKVYNWKHSLV